MEMTPTTKSHALQAMDMARDEVIAELANAIKKHPYWPVDLLHQFAIVQEEIGETQREVLQFMYETKPEDAAEKLEMIRSEMIQATAMCLRFLSHLEIDPIEIPKP